jgi:drug/metabolite transporter (DMT)-like permease
MALATLFLSPYVLLKKRHELRSISLQQLSFSLLIGAALAAHFSLWITSLTLTSVASSVVLVTSHPFFVALISAFFFKETLGRRSQVGIVLSFCGIIVLSYSDLVHAHTHFVGDALAFLGGLAAGIYILGGRRIRQQLSLTVYVFLVYGMCALILLFLSLSFNAKLLPISEKEAALFLLMVLFPTYLGHTLYNWYVKYVKAAVVSVSLVGEPIGASVLAMVVLHEAPGIPIILGGAICLMGIYMVASQELASYTHP